MLCLKWSCLGLESTREKLTNTFMPNPKIVKGAHPPNVHINKQLVVNLLSFLLHVVMTDASQDGPQPSGQRGKRRNTNYTSDTWPQNASPKIPQAFEKNPNKYTKHMVIDREIEKILCTHRSDYARLLHYCTITQCKSVDEWLSVSEGEECERKWILMWSVTNQACVVCHSFRHWGTLHSNHSSLVGQPVGEFG